MAKTSNLQVKNITGSTIEANTIVYITGVTDDDDQIVTIGTASNDSEKRMPAVGATVDAIANNEVGQIRITGPLGGFDTTKAKVNALVYVGKNGGILFKNPAETDDSGVVQQIGTVISSKESPEGRIFLLPIEVQVKHAETHKPNKSDPFVHAIQHHLGGKDLISHSKITGLDEDGHIQYSRVDGTRAFTGTVSGKEPTQSSHLATKNYIDSTFIQGSASIGQVAFFTATRTIAGESGLFWDSSTDRLGIGVATPQNKLDVEGGAAIGASYSGTNSAPTNGLIVEGRVGIGTNSPATSALLELSSTTGALLVPRMTTGERDSLTAVDGMIIYNTTTAAFNKRQAGAWVAF